MSLRQSVKKTAAAARFLHLAAPALQSILSEEIHPASSLKGGRSLHQSLTALRQFFRKQTVLCVSAVLALLSAAAVPPDADYLTYPDFRTLALLFCLMAIVAGFRSLGVFLLLGESLLARARTLRKLSVTMVLLCFFSSMIITNDVTLITFIPFTLLVFRRIGEGNQVLTLAVLETIAANLGSMATPIGNPQNIYLCSIAHLSMADFARAVLPYAALSLVLLAAAAASGRNHAFADTIHIQTETGDRPLFPALLPYLFLLVLALLVVFHVLPYGPVFLVTAAVLFVTDRKIFRGVDYFLLLTFLCFFIFVGNVRRLPEVNALLTSLVAGRELWTGLLASQIISNVPAAVLLSGFSRDYAALLTGVNLGGLGTLVASLASLITFQLYSAVYPYKKAAFLKVFTLWNLAFLAVLSLAAVILT